MLRSSSTPDPYPVHCCAVYDPSDAMQEAEKNGANRFKGLKPSARVRELFEVNGGNKLPK